MAQNDPSEIERKWRAGVEFSYAWRHFADPHALRTFRACNSLGGQISRQILMVADLWARLNSGELEAFGKCVAPTISDGPVLIKSHTFEFEPPRGIEDSNDFEIAGWRYEGVKVARASIINDEDQPTPVGSVGENKRGGGRRDTYEKSSQVLETLYLITSNHMLSAERLHPQFKLEFESQFPIHSYHTPAPSERTLRIQLKRFRKKLAETGNN